MGWNKIGVVTKPQALKGQFRLKPSLLNLKSYKKMGAIKIDDNEYNVESVTLRDTFVIFKLQGIDTCEQAELLRNKEVFADIVIDTDENFDLVNFDVYVEGIRIGSIISIDNFGSKDILSIAGARNVMAPVIDGLIQGVDEACRVVNLNKEILEQVAVYED